MPKTAVSKISAERFRYLFGYDSDTGNLTRLIYVSPKGYVGNIIKHVDLVVDGESHSTSRYVWLHYYGEWPPLDKWVDHKDHDRFNNRIDNLRLASVSENSYNRSNGRNQYGCKGIEFRNRRKPWVVRIWQERKRIYIGSYLTFEEAEIAHGQAIILYHGEFACQT